jgi:Fe-S oxidoreductase
MNPGKIVAPYRIDQNLRLGADYRPPQVATHFQFPADRHSFAFTTTRCVGVGDCRREHGGTMCPSYRVTHDEEHSTRGRAHLLFEMLEGDPLDGGWRDEHVKDALDLCLACKGCKGDCPVQVDMASYKAEFLSHYYAGRLRPRSAYAMGYIHLWARAAALAPRLVNALTHMPVVSAALKALGGISTRRSVPQFADRTFTDRFRERPRATGRVPRTRVLLWPDTFNNHFHPDTAMAAVEVLEDAGCEVVLPSRPLCCGRPLYDFGFLGAAKRLLRDILQELRPHLEAGTPIVVLEPSCLAVFRDELMSLFPDDEDAKRLSGQAVLLSEFLRKVPGYQPPRLAHDVMLHGHCHHKAIASIEDEEALLRGMTPHVDALDSGCCGMAGSFGFEAEHYDVAMDVGELVLLPAVRRASSRTLIVADGFSCREQIAQATGRRAVHLAEAISGALHEVRMDGHAAAEDVYLPARQSPPLFPRELAAAACIGIGIGMAALEWRRGHRHGGRGAALSRSSSWSRAAWQCSATSSSISSRRTRTRSGCRAKRCS